MKLIIRLLINVFALYVVSYLVPGVLIADIRSGIVAAVVIGIVNTLIRPIIQLIALPISLLTLGLAAFFINVALLYLVSLLVPGFEIANFTTAVIASIVLALVSWFLHKLARD